DPPLGQRVVELLHARARERDHLGGRGYGAQGDDVRIPDRRGAGGDVHASGFACGRRRPGTAVREGSAAAGQNGGGEVTQIARGPAPTEARLQVEGVEGELPFPARFDARFEGRLEARFEYREDRLAAALGVGEAAHLQDHGGVTG